MKPQDSFEKIKHWLEYLEQKGQCIQSPKGCAKTHILSHAQALKKEIDRLLKINMDLAQDNSDMQFQISCLNAELKSRPKVVRCKDCNDFEGEFIKWIKKYYPEK
jgi:hypothetical protein